MILGRFSVGFFPYEGALEILVVIFGSVFNYRLCVILFPYEGSMATWIVRIGRAFGCCFCRMRS